MKRPSTSEFVSPRGSPRFVPSKSLTVAVLNEGVPLAYGVVANISVGGVCVQSSEFSMKRNLDIVLSFADGKMLEATGRVVWGEPLDREGAAAVYGMEFTALSDKNKANLTAALDSPAFSPADS